jgi:hypothetical protein
LVIAPINQKYKEEVLVRWPWRKKKVPDVEKKYEKYVELSIRCTYGFEILNAGPITDSKVYYFRKFMVWFLSRPQSSTFVLDYSNGVKVLLRSQVLAVYRTVILKEVK